MQLVPGDFISEQDREMQQVLNDHPDLKHQLTFLISSYRELLACCIEDLQTLEVDTADLVIAYAKKENVLRRLGIPLNTPKDWEKAYESQRHDA